MYLNVIEVSIKNKKAVRTNDGAYTCDNSDFTVVFSFDEEWDEFDTKTARFVYGDKFQDVVFSGNKCPMPKISNAKLISVGVFAGDLHTSTPAMIVANKSILSASGVPDEPSPDVYAQIVELCNETKDIAQSVRDDADNGVFDGQFTEADKKEITEDLESYVDKQTELIRSDVEGIQQQMNEEAHFRGYLSTNAKIQSLEATPNDFAYSAESGTKWIYDVENGWQDTGVPVPDQLTPASETTPLINGTASTGTENAYARGDHRHPTDTTRASVEELRALGKAKVDKVETYGLANIEPTPNDGSEYTWDVVRFHNIPFVDGEPYLNQPKVMVYSKEGADERFSPTPITTIPTTLAANKQYNFGEVATLNLAFPTVANDGDVVYLTFKSGSTHTALTIDTTNTCDIEVIPEPNTGYEIYGKYNGSIWIVNYSEYTVSEV